MREIYEAAIEEQPPHELPDADARTMGLRYAQVGTESVRAWDCV